MKQRHDVIFFEDRFISTQGGNCVGLWRHLVFFEAEPSSDTDAELASERYFGKYCFLDQINQHLLL